MKPAKPSPKKLIFNSHEHSHEELPHAHGKNHDDNGRDRGILRTVAAALHLPGHSHAHSDRSFRDSLFTSNLGIRTVKTAFIVLGLTAILQIFIYLLSGSVALLADTVHNIGDALNSIPLWMAFAIGRRAANKRYTYGYGRAEDVAGLLIVFSIVFSAAYILWETAQKFIDPQPIQNLGWVTTAALIGFMGNEVVALLQINVGKQIGSESMIVDGKHARVDGLTSLAVLPAVLGSWLNFPLLDPIMGALIGVAILFITRDAIAAIWYRLTDAVNPVLVEDVERIATRVEGVKQVNSIRMRWVGHRLFAEIELTGDMNLTLLKAQDLRVAVSHELEKAISNLSDISIVISPG